MKPFVIVLGPVTLDLAVGDADHNGALDLTLGIKISGSPFAMHFPPINLDAALAKSVGDTFHAVADKVSGKR